jgi:hypothetical protein
VFRKHWLLMAEIARLQQNKQDKFKVVDFSYVFGFSRDSSSRRSMLLVLVPAHAPFSGLSICLREFYAATDKRTVRFSF